MLDDCGLIKFSISCVVIMVFIVLLFWCKIEVFVLFVSGLVVVII